MSHRISVASYQPSALIRSALKELQLLMLWERQGKSIDPRCTPCSEEEVAIAALIRSDAQIPPLALRPARQRARKAASSLGVRARAGSPAQISKVSTTPVAAARVALKRSQSTPIGLGGKGLASSACAATSRCRKLVCHSES